MTYEVIIKLLDTVEYKGIFSLQNNKIYIRSLIDEDEYEAMFWQLIKKGYTQVEQNGLNYKITREEFNNNLVKVFEKLQSGGLEIAYEEVSSSVFSLVADGDDLNPEVIAYIGTGTRFVQSAESIYRYINNVDYEPKILIRSASYAVDIQDVKNDDDKLIKFIDELNREYIDVSRYLDNGAYRKALQNLFDMVSVTTLKTLSIVIQSKKEPLTISIKAIKKLKKSFKMILSHSMFEKSFDAKEQLRAFDDKNKRVLLDLSSVYHLHFNNDNLYEKIKQMHNEDKNITLKGNYKSTHTIDVLNVVEDT